MIFEVNSDALLSVLLAHPGTQYAPHLARELGRRGLLRRYWTGFALAEQGWAGRLVKCAPSFIRQRLGKRLVGIASTALRTLPRLDWQARKAARRQGDEAAFFERNRRFQEAIPAAELLAAAVVIGFDTSSWLLARRAKAAGKRFILDQSIGHPAAKERIFAALRQRFPDWSTSAPQKAAAMVESERAEHALADLIVVPSEFVKQTLVSEGVEAEKIHVIPFGTDLTLFHPGAERRHAVRQPVIFLFVGGLSARKGVPVLLAAWRQLALADAELWLAGPGTLPAGEMSTLPASVKLLGNQNRQQVAALMQAADVFVFPSFFEGLAQVQIEAQAAGLPLIATLESGASELISEGENGFIVGSGDAESLAERMRRLAADPVLRERMRQAALAGRARLGWDVYGSRWAELLQATP
ncbi:MAG: glycosyltransferase family 4 protein [Prosthecobacter sp.]|uniref:glycosyltransferase family 4 protein n=1 Tax=Prosthecobacter sp. TaxID=1965333 RepID=UPI003900C677